ncbi:hypothetical protein pclt_cds_697 [Pandoravirus celtis]|uniref:DUF5848 domain-containing protein n=1 Tax=Pandoravirus celtis TaxID=2568002 RepID=A0A4D6EIX3_9VIRU|nr:hypothetical protein pclt_cds_697 [Pandoravirus celtis]
MDVKRITPTKTDFRDLFRRLYTTLAPGRLREADAQWKRLLLADIGSTVEPGTERGMLTEVYIPLWASLAESSRLDPASVVDVEWPPTPLSRERDIDRALETGGADSPAAIGPEKALADTFEPLDEGSGDLLDAMCYAIDTKIMQTVANHYGAGRGPIINQSGVAPASLVDKLRARGYDVEQRPCESEPYFVVTLDVIRIPPTVGEIWDETKERIRTTLSQYDQQSATEYPSIGIPADTPAPVLDRLRDQGYHVGRPHDRWITVHLLSGNG